MEERGTGWLLDGRWLGILGGVWGLRLRSGLVNRLSSFWQTRVEGTNIRCYFIPRFCSIHAMMKL